MTMRAWSQASLNQGAEISASGSLATLPSRAILPPLASKTHRLEFSKDTSRKDRIDLTIILVSDGRKEN
jgi:hypothetical protein